MARETTLQRRRGEVAAKLCRYCGDMYIAATSRRARREVALTLRRRRGEVAATCRSAPMGFRIIAIYMHSKSTRCFGKSKNYTQ